MFRFLVLLRYMVDTFGGMFNLMSEGEMSGHMTECIGFTLHRGQRQISQKHTNTQTIPCNLAFLFKEIVKILMKNWHKIEEGDKYDFYMQTGKI